MLMCRLLGILARVPTAFEICLRDAPRSLACLSRENRDGWGVAVHSAAVGWCLHRHTECACDDPLFGTVAASSRGELLIAHVRRRTVGATTLANTHPFRRGRWVFAHNGTIDDIEYVRAHSSIRRLRERTGDTDSELLFAFVLSRLDAARVASRAAGIATDATLIRIVQEIAAHPKLGSSNFLLSDGVALYAHRSGRALHTLVRERRDGQTHASSPVALVASEATTDEPWQPVAEGALLRASHCEPRWETLLAGTIAAPTPTSYATPPV